MNLAKSLTLLAVVVVSMNTSRALAQVSTISANYVKSVRTTSQPPTPKAANLSAFFALRTYFLTVNSASKNEDGVVGINYPSQGAGKFPANAGANFVNNFTNFHFQMSQPTQPSNGAFPFAVVVQDQVDGFYHVSNGSITKTGAPIFKYQFDAPASGTWNSAFDKSDPNGPKITKLALIFSGDFVTPVKTVFIPVTLTGPLAGRNPVITSSTSANNIPGSHAIVHYSTGTADTKFNFDTANNQ
jgi:hypothetical protein